MNEFIIIPQHREIARREFALTKMFSDFAFNSFCCGFISVEEYYSRHMKAFELANKNIAR